MINELTFSGIKVVRYDNGNIKYVNHLINGEIFDGTTEFYENGFIKSLLFSNGSVYELFDKDGFRISDESKRSEYRIKDDLNNDWIEYYDFDSNLINSINAKKDVPIIVEFSYNDKDFSDSENKKDGYHIFFSKHGLISKLYNLKNGEIDGVYYVFDGYLPVLVIQYSNGKINGERIEYIWYRSEMSKKTFKDGFQVGYEYIYDYYNGNLIQVDDEFASLKSYFTLKRYRSNGTLEKIYYINKKGFINLYNAMYILVEYDEQGKVSSYKEDNKGHFILTNFINNIENIEEIENELFRMQENIEKENEYQVLNENCIEKEKSNKVESLNEYDFIELHKNDYKNTIGYKKHEIKNGNDDVILTTKDGNLYDGQYFYKNGIIKKIIYYYDNKIVGEWNAK